MSKPHTLCPACIVGPHRRGVIVAFQGSHRAKSPSRARAVAATPFFGHRGIGGPGQNLRTSRPKLEARASHTDHKACTAEGSGGVATWVGMVHLGRSAVSAGHGHEEGRVGG